MNLRNFELSPKEAVAQQRVLREQVETSPRLERPRIVAGADISYNKFTDICHAGFVLFDYETKQPIARSLVTTRMNFPYVPGLLSYREIPTMLPAWDQIPVKPDVVFLDGHGLLHPRRLGIACHFGLVAEVPTIGNGKSVLIGKFAEPGPERGNYSYMRDGEEIVGAALRTKNKVKPVYVSIGHRVDLKLALALTLRFTGSYRIPEPTRQAHLAVNALRRGEIGQGYTEL